MCTVTRCGLATCCGLGGPRSKPTVQGAENLQGQPPSSNSRVRRLTEGEKQIVRSIFGDSIKDLDKVEIHHPSYFPLQPSGVAVAPNGNIYLGKDLRHITDFSKQWHDKQADFIHEMTHVWQRQNGMNVVARRLFKPFATYNYVIEDGKPFHKYTMEQQATIVEDYVRSLHGETAVKHGDKKGRVIYPPAVYESLLPWMRNRPQNAPRPPLPSPRP